MIYPKYINELYRVLWLDGTPAWLSGSKASGNTGTYYSLKSAKLSANYWGTKRYQIWKFSCALPGHPDSPYFAPEMVYEQG